MLLSHNNCCYLLRRYVCVPQQAASCLNVLLPAPPSILCGSFGSFALVRQTFPFIGVHMTNCFQLDSIVHRRPCDMCGVPNPRLPISTRAADNYCESSRQILYWCCSGSSGWAACRTRAAHLEIEGPRRQLGASRPVVALAPLQRQAGLWIPGTQLWHIAHHHHAVTEGHLAGDLKLHCDSLSAIAGWHILLQGWLFAGQLDLSSLEVTIMGSLGARGATG
jgi:hypothetical protein